MRIQRNLNNISQLDLTDIYRKTSYNKSRMNTHPFEKHTEKQNNPCSVSLRKSQKNLK